MTVLPKLRDFEDAVFDPFDQSEAWGDCYDFWKLQLETWEKGGPVQPGSFRRLAGLQADVNLTEDQPTFMVFGTELVRQILNDDKTFTKQMMQTGFRATFGNSLTAMDAPDHPRYRRIFQKAFLPGVVAQWSKSMVEPVIQEIIGTFKQADKVDIVEAFTFPYPFEIIYRQLRLPTSEIKTFHKLAVALVLFQSNLEKSVEAGEKLGEFFEALLDERRRNPGDDLISHLALVEADGERLPDEVIISFLRQLMNAAGDTTFRSTGSMLVCLLRDRPDQYAMLVKDRSLIPNAVEETLRLYAPTSQSSRYVAREVEIEGVKIPAGSVLDLATGLVGRDPVVFPDPHRFDLTRDNSGRHMGFSNGPHICLGQHLARLEMSRALAALLDHFPNMRLDPDYPPPQIYGHNMRAPNEIHVLLQ